MAERNGTCRICLHEGKLTRHHLIPRAQLIRKRIAGSRLNVVLLCAHCHRRVDNSPRTNELRTDYRRRLRLALTDTEVAYVRKQRGQQWLDHHYPLDTYQHDIARPLRRRPEMA